MKKITLLAVMAMLWPKIRHKTIPILILSLFFCTHLFAQQHTIQGNVSNSQGIALHGATVKIKEANSIQTDAKGNFSLKTSLTQGFLIISFIGYKSKALAFEGNQSLKIILENKASDLQEVQVVSTGYQTLPKERATGSFVVVDSALLNRSVSSNILDRLDGVVPGLIFNNKVSDRSEQISIRGRNTISSSAKPLIVIDNFPYTGNLEDINPNDVESVAVLKDAGAASIWGARAGNGVIVITTKKGTYQNKTQINVAANILLADKPNLYINGNMNSSDYIDAEITLFNKNFYQDPAINIAHTALTPVVDLLFAAKKGSMPMAEAMEKINAFRNIDFREQQLKYLYRNSQKQQYSIQLNSGTLKFNQKIALGFDRNLAAEVGNEDNRFTLNATQNVRFLNNKLELKFDTYLTLKQRQLNALNTRDLYLGTTANQQFIYPYMQLADGQGEPLNVAHLYESTFEKQAEANGLLNWQYNPLNELNLSDNKNLAGILRFNTAVNYELFTGLKINLLYQWSQNKEQNKNLHRASSFFTRDLVNRFTTLNTNGNLTLNIPNESILDSKYAAVRADQFRIQANYNKSWAKNYVNLFGGWEISTNGVETENFRSYGYDLEHALALPVDYITSFRLYNNSGQTATIPYANSFLKTTDNLRSYFISGTYIYNDKYIFNGSLRKDESNLFGVAANQKGVPLWSLGLAWDLSKESFFNISQLDYLKLRSTVGYSGNVNNSLTAYTTAKIQNGVDGFSKLPYSLINTPPNAFLRWEKVRQINIAADFSALNKRFSGSVDFYFKKNVDLIGPIAVAAQTGFTNYYGNAASSKGKGFDINLNALMLKGPVNVTTNFFISHIKDKVTEFEKEATLTDYFINGSAGAIYPILGKPYSSIFSFQSDGLDPLNGDPIGYLNGEKSKDYTAIVNKATFDNVIFNGSAQPTYFGSIRNNVSFRNFTLSFNITYRFGYYFRKSNPLVYANLLQNGMPISADYSNRWKQPGDENLTTVPSLSINNIPYRDTFYIYSNALVNKGDHIRLSDINFSYSLNSTSKNKLPFKSLQLFAYLSNVGMLWKATKFEEDPDYLNGPVRTYAIGFKLNI